MQYVDVMKQPLIAKCVTESTRLPNQIGKIKNSQDSHMKVNCTQCDKPFSSKDALKFHMRIFHGHSGSHRCKDCFRLFAFKSKLERHRSNKNGCYGTLLACAECSKTFASHKLLINHMQIHNKCYTYIHKPAASCKSILFSCTGCSKTFASESGLSIHLKTHNTSKSPLYESLGDSCSQTSASKIPDCKKLLVKNKSSQSLVKKTKRKPWKSKDIFKCLVCGKVLADKYNLEQHTRIHTGELPYKCTQCGKKFAQKGACDVHMRIHTDERPYHCSKCPMTFRYSDDLKTHLLVHSGKLSICGHCRRHFHCKTAYQKHLLTHKDSIKSYQCLKCSKFFKTVSHLKRHMVIHFPQMYQCYICERPFVYSHHLHRHMKSHHKDTFGLTKWCCDLCGKGFSDIEILKEHQLVIHDRKFMVYCKECGFGFSKHSQLNIHIYRKHGHFLSNDKYTDAQRNDTLPDTHDDTLCPICNKRYSSKGSRNKHYRLYHSKKVT